MEKPGAWQCPFLCCAYEQRARCLRRLMRTGARVCTLTLWFEAARGSHLSARCAAVVAACALTLLLRAIFNPERMSYSWRLARLRFCCGWTMEKLGGWQCPFLCCAYEQRARCLRRLMRTGARVCTLTLLSRVGGEDLSGDMRALSSRVNGAWYLRRFTANRCAVIHVPLPCAQMACDIRVFANEYDGCAFLNCGLVRGIQISHPFSVSAGAIAFL